jgi:hypothetical protein
MHAHTYSHAVLTSHPIACRPHLLPILFQEQSAADTAAAALTRTNDALLELQATRTALQTQLEVPRAGRFNHARLLLCYHTLSHSCALVFPSFLPFFVDAGRFNHARLCFCQSLLTFAYKHSLFDLRTHCNRQLRRSKLRWRTQSTLNCWRCSTQTKRRGKRRVR